MSACQNTRQAKSRALSTSAFFAEAGSNKLLYEAFHAKPHLDTATTCKWKLNEQDNMAEKVPSSKPEVHEL